MSLKVVHVIIGLEVGGAEGMLKRLIEYQTKNTSIIHEVISLTEIGPIGRELQDIGICVYALGMKRASGSGLTFIRLLILLRKLKPTTIQTWMYHADLMGVIASYILCTKKIIWGVNSTDILKGGDRKTIYIRNICSFLSSVVPHKIIYAAASSRKEHELIGYCCKTADVINNGFDLKRLVASRESIKRFREFIGVRNNEFIVGCVGRFSDVKGFDLFVHAASIIYEEYQNVVFVMIGRGLVNDNVVLTRWIKERGLESSFRLLGERNDIPVCLAALDVFCSTSRTEGFPNVVCEAMAMRTPCVVTDVGDSKYIVHNAGVVVKAEDPVAISSGILKLLTMSARARKKLGCVAHNRVVKMFSIDNCSKKFEHVYRENISVLS